MTLGCLLSLVQLEGANAVGAYLKIDSNYVGSSGMPLSYRGAGKKTVAATLGVRARVIPLKAFSGDWVHGIPS
jgi:hypothetical protein